MLIGFLNSNQRIITVFLGDKCDAIRLDEKQDGGTEQQMNALLKCEILTTWNFKCLTADSSLLFPMKNLMLKASNTDVFTAFH